MPLSGRPRIVRGNAEAFAARPPLHASTPDTGSTASTAATAPAVSAPAPPSGPAEPAEPIAVVWQFCRGDDDITAGLDAGLDAGEIRAWDGDVCVLVIRRDHDDPARWRLEPSDVHLPGLAFEHRFTGRDEALEYVGAVRGRLYVTAGGGL